ncbi:protein crumbs homolog 2-like [Mantella aurantiaca]
MEFRRSNPSLLRTLTGLIMCLCMQAKRIDDQCSPVTGECGAQSYRPENITGPPPYGHMDKSVMGCAALSREMYRIRPQDVPHRVARCTASGREMCRTRLRDVPHRDARFATRCAAPRREMCRTEPRDVPHRTVRCATPGCKMCCTRPWDVLHQAVGCSAPGREMCCTRPWYVLHRAVRCATRGQELYRTGLQDVPHQATRWATQGRKMCCTGPQDVLHQAVGCAAPGCEMYCARPWDVLHQAARCAALGRGMCCTSPWDVLHRAARCATPGPELYRTGLRDVPHQATRWAAQGRKMCCTGPLDVLHQAVGCAAPGCEICCTRPWDVLHQFARCDAPGRRAQDCLPTTCLNGGTCLHTHACVCPVHPLVFTGLHCEVLYDACARFGCPPSHMCQAKLGFPEYQCLCQSGINCTTASCASNPCDLSHSLCSGDGAAFTCKCRDGYGGPECQDKVSPCARDPCDHHAQCVETAQGYTCLCQAGYTGQNCETAINLCASNPCQNDAICVDKANRYKCFCVPGFQGHHCEIDINECASAPCQNNGTCLNQMDQYECQCATGYAGVNCETEIDECQSNPCHNGATCRDYVGYFRCECPAGYEGEVCQQDIDECLSQPCLHGGVCVDSLNRFHCDCSDTGFVGETCEMDILECSSNPCVNNATCVEGVKGYACVCWTGYWGVTCELDIDECADHPCYNDALCLERSNETFYWTEPEFSAEFSYANAAGYVCRCQPGFTGENCSVNIDECTSRPCQNGGACVDLINGYECLCEPGYAGVLCAVNVDECEHRPCRNGATCVDGVADYTCVCPPPGLDGITWGGKNCSVVLEGCSNHSCQNDAACIPTYEREIHRYSCQCQPGFYGEQCSIPTTFSFTSGGYVFYELSVANRSRRSVQEGGAHVTVGFRTTLPNMVLLYRGDEDDYLILELYNGLLHVSFHSRNSSSRLVIDERRVDDGRWHDVWVRLSSSLEMTLHREGCRNGSCSRTEDFGGGGDFRLPESFGKVYIGGLANSSLLLNTLSRKNFTGCMRDLTVDFRTLLPQNMSQETAFEMELGCNKPDWCNPNPCHHESPCIDLWTKYKCDCVRPYTGPSCTQEYTSGTFFHEMVESYASFSIAQDVGDSFNVSAFIRTLKPDGLLFQIGNGSTAGFTVYLKSGRIHVAVTSVKAGPFSEYVSNGKKHKINISVKGGHVSVSIMKTKEDLGQLPPLSLSAGDMVLVGGTPPNGNIDQWGGYFKGCLQDIRLNDNRLKFFPPDDEDVAYYPVSISNVTEDCVSDDTCKSGPCKNEGTCAVTWNEFTCTCSVNFTGATCEEPVWCYRRPCPADSKCRDIPGGYTCLVNATFEEQDLVVFTSNISSDIELTSVSLDFRTRDEDAVLFWASKDLDHISINIQDGHLHVSIQSGNSVEGVSYNGEIKVSDALWHKVLVKMKDSTQMPPQWIIHYDNEDTTTLLGSAGSLSFLTENTPIVLAQNYTGCLGQVSVGGFYIPFADQIFPQPFVRTTRDSPTLGCRGADVCSGAQCLHGGTCQDDFNSFSCACAEGWEGPHCEVNIDDCKSQPCVHGLCIDLEAAYRCSCLSGYTGKNCETNVDDCQHHMCLNGGTCKDGLNAYTCQCPTTYAGDYCQWPYPPEKCGVNVTCLNGGKCKGGIWGANCTCLPGFKGKRCEINIDDCEPNPCLNGGSCQDSVNNFKCICNASFSGVRCEKSKSASAFPFPLLGVAVPVSCGVVLLFIIVVIFIVLTARKRRQSEGTYSPSQQEVAGARLEMDSVLKVPPEERLI